MNNETNIYPEPEKMYVTTSDKILRELNIIDRIFKTQFLKYNATDEYPILLDNKGMSGIDGDYFSSIKIYSNVELLNLQLYKKEYTDRYEKKDNNILLQNQLLEIRKKANDIVKYYNENLTNKNKIVKELIDNRKTYKNFNQIHDFHLKHSAIITISNYRIGEIYLGKENDEGIGSYSFNYGFVSNEFLATFCQRLVNFIDKFELRNSIKTKKGKPANTYEKHKTIESIFTDPKQIQKVIQLLIENRTLNEKGELLKKKFHILPITEALVLKNIIKKDVSETQRNILFAKKVNETISEKTARSKNKSETKRDSTIHSELLEEYKELFDLLK